MCISHCVVKLVLKSIFELTDYAVFARENTVIFKKSDDEVTRASVSCDSQHLLGVCVLSAVEPGEFFSFLKK